MDVITPHWPDLPANVGALAMLASATVSKPGSTFAASATATPCTCDSQAGRAGNSSCNNARFCITNAASSPQCKPRFRPPPPLPSS